MSRLRRLLAALVVSLLAVVCVAAWRIDHEGCEDTATASDAIVVLGARVDADGSPSPTLRARVEHGVGLYRRGLAPRLVFSGGVGDFGAAEARVSLRLAVALGVPESACLLEENSHSTAQNAALTAAVLARHSLRSVIVVTDPYHLPRALRLFAREGVSATGSPVLQAPRHRDRWARLAWTLREVAALTKLAVTPR